MSLPERFNFAEHLFALNRVRPNKLAYIDDTGSLSYAALEERARRLASAVLAAGAEPGDRVLLLMLDGLDWPVAFLGCLYAGVIPVAVNTLLTADDYSYMLNHSGAVGALVCDRLLPTLETAASTQAQPLKFVLVSHTATKQLSSGTSLSDALSRHDIHPRPADTAPRDHAFWLYSSGSTGRPKGTVHTHGSPWWTAELYGKPVLGLTEEDVCFSAAKLYFAYGLGNALTFPLSVGASVVLMAERPTPDAIFKRWQGTAHPHASTPLKPTVFFGAPTGFAGLLAAPGRPLKESVALRMCSSAGEALPGDIAKRFKEHFGCEIIDGIGSTEMLHIFISNRPGDIRYGTTGQPVAGYQIELRGEDGKPVAVGEIGDLYIRGPSAALMYWENAQKTAETFSEGWTKSGDKYSVDEDGYYTYAGRSDDMLKVSGIYVSPFEVESTLMLHPSVLEAAVIGKADADGLTKSKAFVVLKPEAHVSDDDLKLFVKTRLAPYKYPRFIEFVTELPKTATGKIQRFRLRELEARQ